MSVFEKRAPTRPSGMKVYFGMREESRGSQFHLLQQYELPGGNPTVYCTEKSTVS